MINSDALDFSGRRSELLKKWCFFDAQNTRGRVSMVSVCRAGQLRRRPMSATGLSNEFQSLASGSATHARVDRPRGPTFSILVIFQIKS